MENLDEIWQTSVNGQVYETDFAGLVQWIGEGSLLPVDKVRKGNLRWIEANKVPALHRFFNARELESANQVVTTTNVQTPNLPMQTQNFNVNSPQPVSQTYQAPPPPTFYKDLAPQIERKYCTIHTDANAKYHCETCCNYFCKACPKNNSCPMCGAECKIFETSVNPQPFVPQSIPQTVVDQVVVVDQDVRRASNWFFWKAGLTVFNSILMMAGVYWQFFLGLTIPQILHGIVIGVSQVTGSQNLGLFHGIIFLITLIISGLTVFFGLQARRGKKWALILGAVIFAFDGLLYVLTFSLFGALIHAYAIYAIKKGYDNCKAS